MIARARPWSISGAGMARLPRKSRDNAGLTFAAFVFLPFGFPFHDGPVATDMNGHLLAGAVLGLQLILLRARAVYDLGFCWVRAQCLFGRIDSGFGDGRQRDCLFPGFLALAGGKERSIE